MMKIVALFLVPLFMFAKVHYAKVEPYETVVLKSAVSGLVLEADLEAEGTHVNDRRVIHIDDVLDKENDSLTSRNKSLAADLHTTQVDLAKTQKAFNDLKKESSAYLELKAEHQKAAARLAEQTERADDKFEELHVIDFDMVDSGFIAHVGTDS